MKWIPTNLNEEAVLLVNRHRWSSLLSPLQAGAGSNLQATYESADNAGDLTIFGTGDNFDAWKVNVRRTDTTWHNDFTLSVRRSGAGTGGGDISDGQGYQAVGTSDTEFFTGTGDRANIPLQFKLDGMSIHIQPAIYSTTITCTVVDI